VRWHFFDTDCVRTDDGAVNGYFAGPYAGAYGRFGEPQPSPPAPDSAAATRFVQAHRRRFCVAGQAPGICAPIVAPRAIGRVVIHALSSAPDGDCVRFDNVNGVVGAWQNLDPARPWGGSAHYLVDRDGAVTQMVREGDVSFHAEAANPDSIGIEHADICNKPDSFTQALYEASAALVRDIARRNHFPIRVFGIDTNNQNDATVIAHQVLNPVNRDDPGPYWDWEYYRALLLWDGVNAARKPIRAVAMTTLSASVPTGWQRLRRVDVAGEGRNCIPNTRCSEARHSYGDTWWRTRANTAGASDMVFKFWPRQPGLYKLSLYWPNVAGANPQTLVQVDVKKGGGPAMASAAFDQRSNFGRWNDVGVPFTFDVPGAGAEVTLRVRHVSRQPGFVVADAARLLRVA